MSQSALFKTILHFFLTKIVAGIVLVVAAVTLVECEFRSLLDYTSLSPVAKDIAVSATESAIALIIYILLFRLYEKRKIRELSASAFAANSFSGFVSGLSLQALFILIIFMAGGYTVLKINPAASLLPAFAASLTAGFVAEILFIGIFFRITEEKLGTVITLLIITILFGIFHFNAPGANALSITSTAVEAGLLIAAIFVYTRSLWAVIFFHFGWDLAEPGLFGGINPGMSINETLFTSKITGPAMLTGGETGPQNSIQALLICLAISLLLLWSAKSRNRFINPYWKK